MRATRGDYGTEDDWDDVNEVTDLYQFFKEEK
jgi:hypothetical protein